MKEKFFRFRRPEFQEKLARARKFKRSELSEKLGFRSRVARFFAVVIGLSVIYFVTISKTFLVTKASIPSAVAGGIATDEVEQVLKRMTSERLWYIVPTNHILVLNRQRLLVALQKELPEVRGIQVFKRIVPHTVELALEKRSPLYIWQSGADYFLLDQDGIIFQKIANYTPDIYSQVLIRDSTQAPIVTGQTLDIEPILRFASELEGLWSKEVTLTNYESFSIPGAKSSDLLVKTVVGFTVYFDLVRSARVQIKNLNLVLTQQINPDTYSGLSYIDLRLPNTAYYCYKDAPCALENATSTPTN